VRVKPLPNLLKAKGWRRKNAGASSCGAPPLSSRLLLAPVSIRKGGREDDREDVAGGLRDEIREEGRK